MNKLKKVLKWIGIAFGGYVALCLVVSIFIVATKESPAPEVPVAKVQEVKKVDPAEEERKAKEAEKLAKQKAYEQKQKELLLAVNKLPTKVKLDAKGKAQEVATVRVCYKYFKNEYSYKIKSAVENAVYIYKRDKSDAYNKHYMDMSSIYYDSFRANIKSGKVSSSELYNICERDLISLAIKYNVD